MLAIRRVVASKLRAPILTRTLYDVPITKKNKLGSTKGLTNNFNARAAVGERLFLQEIEEENAALRKKRRSTFVVHLWDSLGYIL